jgi:pimeloyl-ACP methyl ester carboxylesterase
MRLCMILILTLCCCTTVYTKSSYTSISCPSTIPPYTVECGTLTVPESRQSASGSIALAVVIIRTRAADPAPDPVVYLAGGPGGSSTAYAEGLVHTWLKPFLATRDVILIDQRGTGESTPSLACDEYSYALLDQISTAASASQTIQGQAAALQACQERLTREGVLTSAYTSAESAADLEDLRVALNIEKWNLLGVSYGTRLALTVLRDHPQGVRSVILDSVYPPQVNLFVDAYANGERARQEVFAACAQDEKCAAAYPDLEDHFWQLVAKLNESPEIVTVQLSRQPRDFVWTGDRLYGLVFQWMYDYRDIALIPHYIDLLWQGEYDDITLLRSALQAELSSLGVHMGLYMSIQCGEERPATLALDRESLLQIYPRLTSLLNHDLWLSDAGDTTCRTWQPDLPPDLENQPIVSDVPALLLSGGFDPITPPAWAELAARTLTQSQTLFVPHVGHGVIRSSACVESLIAAYLNAPTETLNLTCSLEGGLPFFVPRDQAVTDGI